MKLERPMEEREKRGSEVMCLGCFHPFWPAKGTVKEACPTCGMEWRISWPDPQTARIRGPVWEKFPR
jgi:predicted RNA-binding Zn-ribbon protein involved in translation (DUF1610 family)